MRLTTLKCLFGFHNWWHVYSRTGRKRHCKHCCTQHLQRTHRNRIIWEDISHD